MTDPRYGERREWDYDQWNAHWGGEGGAGWAIGGLVALVLLIGLAMWGASYSTQTASMSDDATTGQGIRPPMRPMPPMTPSP